MVNVAPVKLLLDFIADKQMYTALDGGSDSMLAVSKKFALLFHILILVVAKFFAKAFVEDICGVFTLDCNPFIYQSHSIEVAFSTRKKLLFCGIVNASNL